MTTSPPAVRLGAQRPRVAKYPDHDTSAAPEFIDLAASAGLQLDPWQRYVLEHGLGERPDGRCSATKCSVWVPRQNGKGGVIEALELGWLFLTQERLILHSAHEYKTAQEAFLRIKGLVEQTPDLDRRVNRYWQANGEQGIELTRSAGGGRLRFIARSRGSGRGFSGGKNVLDEAQEITAQQMAALMPTLSAQPDPQIWFFGTPPEAPDAWCYGLRDDGEAGVPRMMHMDWGADLDPTDAAEVRRAMSDRERWYQCNPSLGIRITEETVEDEAKPSGLGDRFVIERLGAWWPRMTDGKAALDLELWAELADEDSCRVGELAFAVDVTPSRDWASIAVYGPRADELGHLEVIDRRPGTDWLVERLATLKERYNPIAIALDLKGPAGSLLVDLEKRGITRPEDPDNPRRGDLAIPSAMDVAAACGQLADAITQRTVRHIGQDELEAAIRGAKTRSLGDAWAWGRRISTVDISPLVAVTLARWAYESRVHLVEDDYDIADSFG
ncbi:terminase [Actinacidiphila glaucinigra]|uniref:terminase n=1 Tax=Actinacidiphila glaucinigra TaxID=235986 RepID=UPI002E309F51|nr:terminase [Actinacidiphila glaucinigra]